MCMFKVGMCWSSFRVRETVFGISIGKNIKHSYKLMILFR